MIYYIIYWIIYFYSFSHDHMLFKSFYKKPRIPVVYILSSVNFFVLPYHHKKYSDQEKTKKKLKPYNYLCKNTLLKKCI